MAKKKRKGDPKKGGKFERLTCKELSLWFTNGERDDIFWRTAGSGARATVRKQVNQDTANSAGDMGTLDHIGDPFIEKVLVELKRGYTNNITVLGFIDGANKKDPILFEWWVKAEEERVAHNRRQSMIIFKRDRKNVCVIISLHLFSFLESHIGDFDGTTIDLTYKGHKITISDYQDFFEWFTPEDLKWL